MPRVLVIRPEPGAAETARRLDATGLEPILLPLTRIAPLDVALPEKQIFDAVAATSANGMRHAPRRLLEGLGTLPCFVVGATTMKAAQMAGFDRIAVGDGDAHALISLIRPATPPIKRLAYLCGRVRRPTFEQVLWNDGIAVTAIETYDTLPVDYSTDELTDRLGRSGVDAILIHSVEAAKALIRYVAAQGKLFGNPTAVAISPRVAAIVAGTGLDVVVASEPDEASMLSGLRSALADKRDSSSPSDAPRV